MKVKSPMICDRSFLHRGAQHKNRGEGASGLISQIAHTREHEAALLNIDFDVDVQVVPSSQSCS